MRIKGGKYSNYKRKSRLSLVLVNIYLDMIVWETSYLLIKLKLNTGLKAYFCVVSFMFIYVLLC